MVNEVCLSFKCFLTKDNKKTTKNFISGVNAPYVFPRVVVVVVVYLFNKHDT